jgi:hypothetical protein
MNATENKLTVLKMAVDAARQYQDEIDGRLEGAIKQAEKTGRPFSESFQQFCTQFRGVGTLAEPCPP